jgi:formylglycine-generating enzyme required for sulfatase activity/predicted DNA-binding WGR domain protein
MAVNSGKSRKLVFSEGKSNKFWNICLKGKSFQITFGRIGTNGQTQEKSFDSAEEAKASFDMLVAEKLRKGYVDAIAVKGKANAKQTAVKSSGPKGVAKSKKEDLSLFSCQIGEVTKLPFSVVEKMRKLQIGLIRVKYDGCGDDGEVSFVSQCCDALLSVESEPLSTQAKSILKKSKLSSISVEECERDLSSIEKLIWRVVPKGWEIHYGSSGTILLDSKTATILINHEWREGEEDYESEYVDDDPRPERPDPSGPVTNSIGMKLVPIPAGTFLMGDPKEGDALEHQVTLTQNFYLGMTQVTQAQYMRVKGKNSSHFQGDEVNGRDSSEFPVENVSWKNAIEFCKKLSELPEEKAAGRVYRLPTEAEWEYACRAGSKTAYSFRKSSKKLGDYAWFEKNSNDRTHPVALKEPNAWGLYDMHGNVSEWCSDWYGDYPEGAVTDPSGPEKGSDRVLRGGSWGDDAAYCRSASRYADAPTFRTSYNGFRVALSSPGIPK